MNRRRLTIVTVLFVAALSSASAALAVDLIPFNPSRARVQQIGGRWKITVGSMWLKDFGGNRGEALQALRVIRHYGLNQQGFVGRPGPSMEYYLVSGRAPVGAMPGEDAVAFNNATTRVRQIGGRWKVVDGNHRILDFGGSRSEAVEAYRIIRRYGFNRICFVGRPGASMTYFRAEACAPQPQPQPRDGVRITRVRPGTTATLPLGGTLSVRIDYRAVSSNEVLILARPYRCGRLVPGYAAHPSPTYPRGSGTADGWFKFNCPAYVDEVRVEMQDRGTRRVLASARAQVRVGWVGSGGGGPGGGDSIRATRYSPSPPATLRVGRKFHVRMEFRVASTGQALAFVRPYTNGSPTPGYRAHPSATFNRGDGTAVGWFFFDSPVRVDEIRVTLRDRATQRVLAERRCRVNLRWRQ